MIYTIYDTFIKQNDCSLSEVKVYKDKLLVQRDFIVQYVGCLQR